MSFVVKAVKGVVKAVGNIVTGVIKAVGNVVKAVVDFVASPFMGLFGVPDMPSDAAEAERQQGVLVQRQGSNVNIPIVYGFRKIAGTVTFSETGEENNKYLWVAYTLCEGPIEGLWDIWIDDHQLDPDVVIGLNEGRTMNITSGKYKDRVKLQFINQPYYYRNLNQHPLRGRAITREAPSWRDDMIYNGIVVMLARYEWKEIKTQEDADNNPFTGNIPVLQTTLLGRRVASLQNSTSEAVGYQTSSYTERYSTNPAEILLDYLRNPLYGKGLYNDEINWSSFRNAAAKCNQEVSYYDGYDYRGPNLTTNIVLDTGATLFANTKTLLTNMRGYLPYVEGRYKLKIEDAGNPTDILSGSASIVKTFNQDNMVGNLTYTGIERGSKYTRVKVKYVSPDDKWTVQEMFYPPADASGEEQRARWISDDGGRENEAEITFPGVTNPAIAYMMARTIALKSRYQDSLSFKADSTAFDLEVGDIVHVSANILKFNGADRITEYDLPWRVVSIKMNNDMTFDIGCVRNPDFIYPHVRANEPDVVIPPYIPKGAEIYYPGNPRRIPIGILPPTRSPHPGLPPDLTPPPGFGEPIEPIIPNLPPTDPGGPDGGGVGGPDGQPNDPDNPNNEPPEPPVVYLFDDAIDITQVIYSTTPGTNAVTGEFTFTQPDHPQYSGIDVFWKLNSNQFTTYRKAVFDNKDTSGAELTFTIENLLPDREYELIARVFYSTGDTSEVRTISYITPVPGETSDVEEGEEINEDGWNVPIGVLTNKRNDYLSAIVGQTLLTNDQPRDPREMQVTITQAVEAEPNDVIWGINVYYKPTDFTYWYRTTHVFDVSYVQGQEYTFTLPDDVGAVGTDDDYDFAFRIMYVDNTESKFQSRFIQANVESPDGGITYDYDPLAGALTKTIKEEVGRYPMPVTDEEPVDPPGINTLDWTLAVRDRRQFPIKDLYGKETFNFYPNVLFDDPDNLWLGLRIRYRSLAFDANNELVQLDFLPVTKDEWGYFRCTFPVKYNQNYEYVITPVVRYQGTAQETNLSYYGKGSINTNESATGVDHWQKLNFQLIDTKVATDRLSDTRTIDPQNPTVQVKEFDLYQLDAVGDDNSNVYYRLKLDVSQIANYEGVRIYRRSIAPAKVRNSWNTTYGGYGRWEIVEDTQSPTNGEVILNLRRSVSFYEFNLRDSEVNPFFGTNKPIITNGPDEFILVVKFASGQYATKGYYLLGFGKATTVAGTPLYKKPLLVYGGDWKEVELTNYNNFPNGIQRNLSDARAQIQGTTTLVNYPSRKTAGGWTLATPLDGPAVK